MGYTKLDPQPGPRSEADLQPDRYDAVAPGLYPGEQALELDTGEHVAVSVDPEWLEGSGVALKGYARWINEDGSSYVAVDGRQVEVTLSNSFDHGWLDKHPLNDLATEIVRIMLGEPEQLIDILTLDGALPLEGQDSETVKKNAQQVLALSDEVRRNASIRAAISHVKDMMDVTPSL